jgi:uncharacterized membrane protein
MRALLIAIILVSASFTAGIVLAGSLDSSGVSELVFKAEFNNSASAFINLSGPVDDVTVKDRSGLILEPEITVQEGRTIILSSVPFDYLEFIVISDSFTAKNGSTWDFDAGMAFSENITAFNASISLPKGAILKSTNGAVQESGDSLLISWKTDSISAGQIARLRASYELPAAKEADNTIFVIAAAFVLILAIYFIAGRQKPSSAPEKSGKPGGSGPEEALESNPVFKTLDETDKEIIREIKREKGKTTQASIYLNTHVPKATLSRRLDSLENRGLIRKTQKGNRNLITLTDVLEK